MCGRDDVGQSVSAGLVDEEVDRGAIERVLLSVAVTGLQCSDSGRRQ